MAKRVVSGSALVVTIGLVLAALSVPTAAVAAVSPDEQWLTSVPGTANVTSTMSFGTTGVTATLGATAARCGGATANGTTYANLISRDANSFFSPQAPTSAVAVSECLLSNQTGTRTVTFNKPVVGPIFHINNLDASKLDFAAPVTLETVKKNAVLQLENGGTRLRNLVNQGTAVCTDDTASTNNPACGSFRMSQNGGAVSTFQFTNTSVIPGNDGWFWSLSFHVAPLTKTFLPAVIVPGQTSALSLTITNPATEGSLDLDGVDFADALPVGVALTDSTVSTVDCGPAVVNGGTVAAGQTTVSVTGASIAAGDVCVVTVNVTSTTPGTHVNNSSNLTTSIGNVVATANASLEVIDTGLELSKTAVIADDVNGNGLADVGDEVEYSFEVTNTGSVAVNDVEIDDQRVAGTTPATQSIPAGEIRNFVATYTVTQADVDAGALTNTATASGVYTGAGGPLAVSSASDTAELPTAVRAPGLTIVKTGSLVDANGNGTADLGETIEYSFVVRNAGNVTLTAVSVVDDLVTGLDPLVVATLAPGATANFDADPYTVTAADMTRGAIVNVASATATSPTGAVITSPDDSVRIAATVTAVPAALVVAGADVALASGAAGALLLAGAFVYLVSRRRTRAG